MKRTTTISLRQASPGCKIHGCYHVAMRDEVDGTAPVLCLFHQRFLRIAHVRVEAA